MFSTCVNLDTTPVLEFCSNHLLFITFIIQLSATEGLCAVIWILVISYYKTGFSYSSESENDELCSAGPITFYIIMTRLLLLLRLSVEGWSLTPSPVPLQVFFTFAFVRKVHQNSSSCFSGTLECYWLFFLSVRGVRSRIIITGENKNWGIWWGRWSDSAGYRLWIGAAKEGHFFCTAATCNIFW